MEYFQPFCSQNHAFQISGFKFHIEKRVCGGDEEHKNICKWHKFQVKSFMSKNSVFFVKIGLTIIKMMTPLRANSGLLQVYEFVAPCKTWRRRQESRKFE
jgi:hypothetical protein